MARIRLAGHLVMMTEERILKSIPDGIRPKGRLKKKWLDSLKEDFRRLGVRWWRRGCV